MTLVRLIDAARALGATVIDAPLGVVIMVPRVVESRTHLTIAQAAERACASERVVRRAIRRGEIEASGSRRSLAVSIASIDAWVKARAVRVPTVDDELDAAVRAREAAAQ